MSPLGGWEGQPIQGTEGSVARPRQQGAIPASLEAPMSHSVAVRERREREARLEAQMELMDPHSPRHRQAERVLVAARKMRKRLEKEAKNGR